MKIRQRLALRFTLVSALLTGAILIFIFIVTRGFVHADFVERLTQQSRFEALHFAQPQVKEVIPPGSFELVNPSISIYNNNGDRLYFEGDYIIPTGWVKYLKSLPEFSAERGKFTTVGRRYDINGNRYLVFVSDKDLPGQHELDILIKAILVGYIVSLVLSYLAGLYFSGNALQPVKHVVEEVNNITKDNLSYRLKIDKDPAQVDEIGELILTFNALLNRIEAAFITQKRFVQHASHELKTPLTAIMAEAELALTRDRTKEDYKRTLGVIVGETERLVNTTQGLLTLARVEENSFHFEMELIDVNTLLNTTLNTFKLHHPDRIIERQPQDDSIQINGNAQLLQLALLNVLNNAAKYSTGKIKISLKQVKNDIDISIRDLGVGIPELELDRVLIPLFRGSNVGNISGAGLGLSLVYRVVKIHSGNFTIESEEGKGTTCTMTFPLSRFND